LGLSLYIKGFEVSRRAAALGDLKWWVLRRQIGQFIPIANGRAQPLVMPQALHG
jgi:hypothetical protein